VFRLSGQPRLLAEHRRVMPLPPWSRCSVEPLFYVAEATSGVSPLSPPQGRLLVVLPSETVPGAGCQRGKSLRSSADGPPTM
jgi:hypothetical protein